MLAEKTGRPAATGGASPALLRRVGPLIEISLDSDRPLPYTALEPLLPELEYDHTTLLYGPEAVDRLTGIRNNARTERKRLYRFDGGGRLVTGAGFIDRVYRFLRESGFTPAWVDATAAPSSPRAWSAKPGRLANFPEFLPTADDHARVAAIRAGGPPADPTDGASVAAARRVVQGEIIATVMRRASKGMGCVVQAPPGAGKSYLVARLALEYPDLRIVMATPDLDNFNKSHRHLTRYLPNVGRLGDGDHTTGRVTVSTFGSLHHVDDATDLLIVDEAHKAAASSTSEALMLVAPRAVRVGLTATPEGRMDNADAKLEWMFGPVAHRVTWPEAIALGMVVPIRVTWLDMNLDRNPAAGHQGIFRKKYGIWRNEERNSRFADAAKALPDGEQTLILAATIEHAVMLRQFLPGYELVYGTHDLDQFQRYEDADLLGADFEPVTRERREALRLAFEAETLKKVIATSVWSTGVSFDSLPTLIRVDAASSAILDEQIPGRVSRAHAPTGKVSGRLIDALDQFDNGFASAARSRSKNYRAKGWSEELPAGGRRR